MENSIRSVKSKPYIDQKPGTSGLRKKVSVFQQDHYVENFTQAILSLQSKPGKLIIGGDGRYYNEEAIRRIVSVCVGNKLPEIYLTCGGILSTPAASAIIRSLNLDGGIILTASHNPGGPNGDIGIKFNCKNGGPAPESVTDEIYSKCKTMNEYRKVIDLPELDLSMTKSFKILDTSIEILDPIEIYLELCKSIFDFNLLRALFTGQHNVNNMNNNNNYNNNNDNNNTTGCVGFIRSSPLKILVDCMNGVMGPYAKRILVDELGAPLSSLMNAKPLPDFGGKHPDPNLTYADELVNKMKENHELELGVAFDGDGDRHMILGENGFFVTPGDSLAVVGHNLNMVKGYKDKHSIRGFARSFPTSAAVDRVAKHLSLECYVTPTGWKFFGNLLDCGKITVCGEESFGVGGDHIREKDGLYSVLIWLTILAQKNIKLTQLLRQHWIRFGRDYFCRYDFEQCQSEPCDTMMKQLDDLLRSKKLVGTSKSFNQEQESLVITDTGNFDYVDPCDGSHSRNQGLYIEFGSRARIIFRLSGTGSSGATVRVYVTCHDDKNIDAQPNEYLSQLFEFALEISQLKKMTGRDKPTVIT